MCVCLYVYKCVNKEKDGEAHASGNYHVYRVGERKATGKEGRKENRTNSMFSLRELQQKSSLPGAPGLLHG